MAKPRYRHYYLSVRSVPRKGWLLPAHGGLAIRPGKYLRQLGRLPVFPPLLQLLRGNWCCQKTHHLILFITILPRYLGIVLPQYFIFPRLYILHGKYHCQCPQHTALSAPSVKPTPAPPAGAVPRFFLSYGPYGRSASSAVIAHPVTPCPFECMKALPHSCTAAH